MGFPFFIARRYLFSKKSRNVINLITGISVVVIGFVTAAMIIVLSAFNGIDMLVDDLYSTFDGDITIRPARGKDLNPDSLDLSLITGSEGYVDHFEIVEQNVLLTYRDQQRVATMKAVPADYVAYRDLASRVEQGSEILKDGARYYALLGMNVNYDLNAGLFSETLTPLSVNAPRRGKRISKDRDRAFKREALPIGGLFRINIDYDSRYFLAPIEFGRELMEYDRECNKIEVACAEHTDLDLYKQRLQVGLGDQYLVSTRMDENAVIYKANESERMVTIVILSFIILIAVFNILASLTMLMIDKANDLGMLHSMGASVSTLRKIFFIEGLLIAGLGMLIGLALGAVICWLQTTVGLVPLSQGIVPYYPVHMRLKDFALVAAIVMAISVAFSWIPVNRMTRGMLLEGSDNKR